MGYIFPVFEPFVEPLDIFRELSELPRVVPSSKDWRRFWSNSASASLTSRAAFLFLKMA